jgi:hypothetical protein
MSVPDFSSNRNDPILSALSKRCEEAKTMGMFRLAGDRFLLVYDGPSLPSFSRAPVLMS